MDFLFFFFFPVLVEATGVPGNETDVLDDVIVADGGRRAGDEATTFVDEREDVDGNVVTKDVTDVVTVANGEENGDTAVAAS